MKKKWLHYLLAGLLVLIVLSAFAVWLFATQERSARVDAQNRLDLIARQKVREIVNWRSDQLEDAAFFVKSPVFTQSLHHLLARPDAEQIGHARELFELFVSNNDCDDFFLWDASGRILLSQSGRFLRQDGYRTALNEAVRLRRPVIADLHRDDINPSIHLSTVAPVFAGDSPDDPLLAVLLLIHNADRFLFPLLQNWPLPSESAESLLVRRDGDEVLFLNDLRHRPDSALSLRIPLSQSQVPAVMAVQGYVGAVEGLDYRGVAVVSVIVPVPDSPWAMVAKVDAAELYDDWRRRAWLLLFLFVSLTSMAGLGILILWQRSMKQRYRSLYDIESSMRAKLERDSVVLNSIADAVIAVDRNGQIGMINSAAEALTGWTADQALHRPLDEVFHIVDEQTRQAVEDPVGIVLGQGALLGPASRTLLIDRLGRRLPVAVSAAPIRNEKEETVGVVLVFRDQSQERGFEQEQEITIELLQILNRTSDLRTLMADVCELMRRLSGCEAVGIRYRDGDDYPYFYTRGFSADFIKAERNLCEYDSQGQCLRDSDGKPELECMCGNVIRGRFNPALPFFTVNGSFWTNSTSELLAGSSEADRQGRTRNRCNSQGYESVALIPLRHGSQNVGLLQLNDKRTGCFDARTIALYERLSSSIAVGFVQRQADEALRENETFIKAVMDNLPLGVAVNSIDPQVKFSYANAKFPQIYRIDPAGLQEPDKFWELVYPDPVFRRQIRDRVLEDCASGDPERMHWDDVPIVREGEPTTYISAMNAPVSSQGVMISLVWDTTARKLAEADKLRLQDQLNQAQKMESVGRLAGGVAHDFNNMLSVILGHAELAMALVGAGHRVTEDLQEIQKAAQRSADLTRQLLAFARKQTIAPLVLDLNKTVGGMIKLLRRLIGEDIDLVWKPGESIWPVLMDPSQLDQILANLCVNARDAIQGVGRVVIETSLASFQAGDCLPDGGTAAGDFVQLSVSDNGSGMSQEVLNRLFEPFFTTKEFGKGTGLGLATVFGTVRQNNGFIKVYSEPGLGTTFRIYLPRHQGRVDGAETTSGSDSIPDGHGETILVIEDERAIQKMTRQMLVGLGYTVIDANSAQEAMTLIRDLATPFQLLITDVIMPQMNGKEFADRLQKLYPGLPVLFTSGYTADVIAHHGVLEDGVSFLQKPYSLAMLARKVHQILSGTAAF